MQEQLAPFPPPPPPLGAAPVDTYAREVALDIARRRGFAIVGWILNAAIGAAAYVSSSLDPGLLLLASVAVLVILVTTTARLAKAVHGTGIAVLCAIGIIVPLVWIGVAITLAVTSSRAIKRGVERVSLFGRDLSS